MAKREKQGEPEPETGTYQESTWPRGLRRRLAKQVHLPESAPEATIIKELARANATRELNLAPDAGWDLIWHGYLNRVQILLFEQGEDATLQQVWKFIATQHKLPQNLPAGEMGERYGKKLYTTRLGLQDSASWHEVAMAYYLDIDTQLAVEITMVHQKLIETLELSPGVSMGAIKAAALGSNRTFDAFLQRQAARKPPHYS